LLILVNLSIIAVAPLRAGSISIEILPRWATHEPLPAYETSRGSS